MKKLLLFPFTLIDKILDRLSAVIFAVLFAQFPQFFTQYLQRLGGHADELTGLIQQYKLAASDTGKTLIDFINVHLKSTTEDFIKTGEIMRSNIERFNDLKIALHNLSSARGINKLLAFIKEIDYTIFKSTAKGFTPGITLSTEGLIYAFSGCIFGIIFYCGLKFIFVYIIKRLSGGKINKKHPGQIMTY